MTIAVNRNLSNCENSPKKSFLYKMRKLLYKMVKVALPMCSFCGKSDESLEHLFIHCEITCNFWLSVRNWLEEHDIFLQNLSTVDITFGFV